TQALTGAGKAHPDRAAGTLHRASEGAIVDHFASNGFEPADFVERGAAKEDAAAGGSGGASGRLSDAARRIKHQEKIEKWRNEQLFGKAARPQENHERSEVERIPLGAGDESAERVGRVNDVRIGEPEKFRRERFRSSDTRVERVELAGPAEGELWSG